MEELKELLIGFEQRLNARIDGVEKSLNERMDQIEKSLNERMDQIEETLNERINQVEEALNERMDQIEKTILDKQFLFEAEYSKKIDMIYDAVVMELDKNLEKSKKIRKLDARMDRSEIKVFDHEKRISILERS